MAAQNNHPPSKKSWSARQYHAIEPFSWCTLWHQGIAYLMKQVLVLFADWELNSDLISGLSFRSEFWQGLVPGALEGQVTPLRASLSLGLPFFLTPCPRPWFTIFSGKVQTAPGPDSLWKYSPQKWRLLRSNQSPLKLKDELCANFRKYGESPTP